LRGSRYAFYLSLWKTGELAFPNAIVLEPDAGA